MDLERQIKYWRNGSKEDIAAAEILINKGCFRHGLFFAHLAIEKILKAHVVRTTGEVPPYIHNLVRLAEVAELPLDAERLDLLRRFNLYQLAGRYPDQGKAQIDDGAAMDRLAQMKEMTEWLAAKL
ncbi:MAG: HEPN domain-containing protein [Candidatus Coatesbacteria bacterium]|nr:HEPN domain-containing protein [Candidatus Coatesbacteria bacterium]